MHRNSKIPICHHLICGIYVRVFASADDENYNIDKRTCSLGEIDDGNVSIKCASTFIESNLSQPTNL